MDSMKIRPLRMIVFASLIAGSGYFLAMLIADRLLMSVSIALSTAMISLVMNWLKFTPIDFIGENGNWQ